MYGVSYGRLPLFKVCGGASPSCRRNPLALERGGSQAQYERLIIEDYGAMLDIFPSSVKFGLFLIILTLILNVFLLCRASKLP